MDRNFLLNMILNKKIVIWGLSETGKKFYQKYKGKLRFICGVSKNNDSIAGLEKNLSCEILDKDYFIVICSVNYVEEIAFELLNNNKKWGVDFITSELCDALMDNKRIVLSVGQCELQVINYIYKNLDGLKNDYYFEYCEEVKVIGIEKIKPILQVALKANFVISIADYFIYPINLSKERTDYYNNLMRNMNKNCLSVSVPFTTFEGYWLQESGRYYDNPKYYLLGADGSLPFNGRVDNNIEKMINDDENVILKKIEKMDFYTHAEVENNFKKSIKKFQLLERKSDIHISDYIRDEYLYRPIYRNRGHASDFLLKEYSIRILQYLNIPSYQSEISKIDLTWYNNWQIEFPIYPCVQKYLKFKKNIYYWYSNEKEKMLTFDQCQKRMIRYMKNINDIFQSIGEY